MATRTYKIYAIAGQSNALGNNLGGAPSVEYGFEYNAKTALLTMDKSCANAFCNELIKVDSRYTPIMTIEAASGVSVTTSTAINWSSSGTLRGNLKTNLDAMVTYYSKTVDGVIWIQGEADAELIRLGTITRAQFKSAMQDLITWWQTNYNGADFYIVRTGFDSSVGIGNASWIDVQSVQDEIASENSNVYVVYNDTDEFIQMGLMYDSVHYTQQAQNIIGKNVAKYIKVNNLI